MRKLLISLLLAGAAATPALADPPNNDRHAAKAEARAERQQAREQSRAPVQVQRPEFAGNPHFNGATNGGQPPMAYRQQVQGDARGGFDRGRFQGGGNVAPQQVVEQQQQQRSYRGYRGGYAGDAQQVEQAQRGVGWSRDRGSWSQNRDGDFRQRDANQQQVRDRTRWASGGWNRDWRNDRRYDWRNYRNRHRSIFRIGIYYDPFGYGYRPYDIGYRLYPAYFGQQYWIDPGQYSLPFPPPGTEWVRYWNDALLVDVYSGEVVDVIHNFFW